MPTANTDERLTLAPRLENLLIQLSGIALVLGLDGRTGQNPLAAEIGLTILIPPQFHDGELLGCPRVHGYGSYERDVYSQ